MNDIEESRESEMPNAEQRQWAMFAHFSACLFFVFGPLVIWSMKKDQMPFVKENAKEALNFQLTVLIALFVSAMLIPVLIGLMLFPGVCVASFIASIMMGVKAGEGELHRYPFTIRFIK